MLKNFNNKKALAFLTEKRKKNFVRLIHISLIEIADLFTRNVDELLPQNHNTGTSNT